MSRNVRARASTPPAVVPRSSHVERITALHERLTGNERVDVALSTALAASPIPTRNLDLASMLAKDLATEAKLHQLPDLLLAMAADTIALAVHQPLPLADFKQVRALMRAQDFGGAYAQLSLGHALKSE